jgi:hypothetical protein
VQGLATISEPEMTPAGLCRAQARPRLLSLALRCSDARTHQRSGLVELGFAQFGHV